MNHSEILEPGLLSEEAFVKTAECDSGSRFYAIIQGDFFGNVGKKVAHLLPNVFAFPNGQTVKATVPHFKLRIEQNFKIVNDQ